MNTNYVNIGPQQGWQCPVCGYIYSPMTPCCYNCNRPDHEKFTTSNKTTIDKCKITTSKDIPPDEAILVDNSGNTVGKIKNIGKKKEDK